MTKISISYFQVIRKADYFIMVIIESDKQLLPCKECCVVLGNFDGVHTGHRFLIDKAKQYAAENSLSLLIYTFATHPKIFYDENFKVITTKDEKSAIFNSINIDYLYYEDFQSVRDMSPEGFCNNILIKKLKAKAVFCGSNHRFGKNASGTADSMREYLNSKDVNVFVQDYLYSGDSIVSSSLIRQKISCGNIPGANKLLGQCFSVNFPVIHGFCLGRKLGFPTINQILPKEKLVPPHGVYACYTHIEDKLYPSVMNIGVKPTITHDMPDPPVLCETHIINFDKDLYGKKICVYLVEKIRDEKRFSDVEQLKQAVFCDIEQAKKILERFNNEE